MLADEPERAPVISEKQHAAWRFAVLVVACLVSLSMRRGRVGFRLAV